MASPDSCRVRPPMATAALGWVAAAKSWRSGRSSPRPATPSSPCHPSRSRRCAVTAASSTVSAWPSASPPPSGCAGSSPASHPTPSSSTWSSALSGARRSTPNHASGAFAQLRHADGGALAQRVYIHQLPQTAPRLAGVIEGVFGPEAHAGRAVSARRRAEGKWRESQPSSPT
jgi:hypothetical protein